MWLRISPGRSKNYGMVVLCGACRLRERSEKVAEGQSFVHLVEVHFRKVMIEVLFCPTVNFTCVLYSPQC